MQRRHFLETAKAVNYSQDSIEHILDEMLEKTDSVINEISKLISEELSKHISAPIFQGLAKAKQKLEQ